MATSGLQDDEGMRLLRTQGGCGGDGAPLDLKWGRPDLTPRTPRLRGGSKIRDKRGRSISVDLSLGSPAAKPGCHHGQALATCISAATNCNDILLDKDILDEAALLSLKSTAAQRTYHGSTDPSCFFPESTPGNGPTVAVAASTPPPTPSSSFRVWVGQQPSMASTMSLRDRQVASIKNMLALNAPSQIKDEIDYTAASQEESGLATTADGELRFRVLVFDDFGRDVISSVLKVSDLRAM